MLKIPDGVDRRSWIFIAPLLLQCVKQLPTLYDVAYYITIVVLGQVKTDIVRKNIEPPKILIPIRSSLKRFSIPPAYCFEGCQKSQPQSGWYFFLFQGFFDAETFELGGSESAYPEPQNVFVT